MLRGPVAGTSSTPELVPPPLADRPPRPTDSRAEPQRPRHPRQGGEGTGRDERAAEAPPDRGWGDGTSTFYDRDGRPGYGNGFFGCYQPTLTAVSRAPSPGLRFELHPLLDAVRPGSTVYAAAVVTNTSTRRVAFNLSGHSQRFEAVLVDAAGIPRSSLLFSDALDSDWVDLAPRESHEFMVAARTVVCGDIAADAEPLLPAGDYTLVVEKLWFVFDDRSADPVLSEGAWVSEPAAVRIDEEAAEPPCRRDGTDCVTGPYDAEPPNSCSEQERDGADYGAERALSLRVELDDDTVRRGENVEGRVVITNHGGQPHWLIPEDPYGSGLLRGAGGPLGDGSGPLGATGSTVGGRTSRGDYLPPPEMRRIDPGESLAVPITVAGRSCADEPLTAGEYRVRSGVYVLHFGWWAAPHTPVWLVD